MIKINQPVNNEIGVLYQKKVTLDPHADCIDINLTVTGRSNSQHAGGTFDIATAKALRKALKVAIKEAKKHGRSLRS